VGVHPLTRPLPLITADNEFFWTSGNDGKLRLQKCADCTALIHPPAPVCRYCYVIAQVAIAEDPRVRLTTNIVECDFEQLELGQQVEVVFEQHEDVWLPLFRVIEDAEPAALPIDEIAPERFVEYVRPMLTQEKFEDKVAFTGIGMSKIGRRLMVPPLSLTVAACEAAIADAGLTFDDIDGLSTYPGGGNLGGFGEGGVTALEAALGLRPTWHNGGIETFGPSGSVITAMLAIACGLARHVLCFRTLWEATFNEEMKQGEIVPSGGRRADWLLPFGATSAAHTLALTPQDVDVAELYDGFTMNCLSWIEALGFCKIGEARDFLDDGKNIARDGQLPLNTHGGQLSHGRTHGMGLLHEAITQLRGEAGERQVTGARVGVVSSGGLTPSGVLLLRTDT
jgi:thiolase-like protein/rubredoxin-like zinc ribbon protein